MEKRTGRWPLQLGGTVILMAAILHVAALFSGPGFIAALGAPANIVDSAAKGTFLAPVVISAIALVLFVVGACALSTAGRHRPLPFSRPILYITATVLVLRAAALPVLLIVVPAVRTQLSLFEVSTAALCLALGALFWLGLRGMREQPGLIEG